MIKQITQFNTQIAALKDIFATYVKDTRLPLSERWDAFATANDALKNHSTYGPSFDCLPDDFIMYGGSIDMDRYQTMGTYDLVEQIEEGRDCDDHEDFHKVDVNALKEEILAANIGSFTYDW